MSPSAVDPVTQMCVAATAAVHGRCSLPAAREQCDRRTEAWSEVQSVQRPIKLRRPPWIDGKLSNQVLVAGRRDGEKQSGEARRSGGTALIAEECRYRWRSRAGSEVGCEHSELRSRPSGSTDVVRPRWEGIFEYTISWRERQHWPDMEHGPVLPFHLTRVPRLVCTSSPTLSHRPS